MRIAIAGTRGIPNDYGGFEQCAEYLSVIFASKGHEVTVYNTHDHIFRDREYKGVRVKHIFNPEKQIGTAGNFIYDYLCMRDAVRDEADVILMLGYTTASVFYPVMDLRSTVLVTNMDGLEWKRDKWNSVVKRLALWFEKLAARHSDFHISDNGMIRKYLKDTYNIDSECIAYGCDPVPEFSPEPPPELGLRKGGYSLVIARLEAENNIHTVIEGFLMSDPDEELIVVGKVNTGYGRALQTKYEHDSRIRFVGGIYDMAKLNDLRHHSATYFHGHSVGGTNPSLLEAMACGCMIVAHDNPFNRWVTADEAFFFTDPESISQLLSDRMELRDKTDGFKRASIERITTDFNWDLIAGKYESYLERCVNARKPIVPVA
jgi:glycosyltransferase involved in cell wall biosynthesis